MDVAEAKMIAAAAKPASRRAQRGSAPTSRRNPQVSSVGFGRERRPSSITGCPNPSQRSGLVFLGKSKSAFFRRQSAGSDMHTYLWMFWEDALGALPVQCRIGHLEGMARLLASRRPYPAQASPGR